MGRGPGPWASPVRGYVLFSQISIPSEGVGLTSLKLLARPLSTGPIVVPCCVLCLRPGRPATKAGGPINIAPAGKPRDRFEIEGNASPSGLEWRADSCQPCRRPISVTAGCSLDNRKSVWASKPGLQDHSAGQTLRSQTPRARQVHHQRGEAGPSKQGATFSGALGPTRTASSSVSRSRTNVHQSSGPGLSHADIVMGF